MCFTLKEGHISELRTREAVWAEEEQRWRQLGGCRLWTRCEAVTHSGQKAQWRWPPRTLSSACESGVPAFPPKQQALRGLSNVCLRLMISFGRRGRVETNLPTLVYNLKTPNELANKWGLKSFATGASKVQQESSDVSLSAVCSADVSPDILALLFALFL